jgi:hypothetical protein
MGGAVAQSDGEGQTRGRKRRRREGASVLHSARAYLAAGRKKGVRAKNYFKNNVILTVNLLGSLQVL